MSNKIEGTGPSPRDIEAYRQEYKHGLDLFQRALLEYNTSDEMHKKAAFQDVMQNALQVLNETARGMKRDDLLKYNDQIAKDLKALPSGDAGPVTKRLHDDIIQAQDFV